MRKVIELGKKNYDKGFEFNACLLYDPKIKSIIMTEVIEKKQEQQTIDHCVMSLIEKFSKKSCEQQQVKSKILSFENDKLLQQEKEYKEEDK